MEIAVVSVWWPWLAPCAAEEETLTLQRTRACYFPGFSNEILGYLLDAAKINHTLRAMPRVANWGTAPGEYSKYWTGTLGMIQNGTLDAMSSLWTINEERSADFLFTYPVTYFPNGFLFRDSEDRGKQIFTLLKVFSPIVWCTFFGTFLGLLLVFCLNDGLWGERGETDRPVPSDRFQPSQALSAVGTIVRFVFDQTHEDTQDQRRRSCSSRILLVTLGIASLFCITLYDCTLLSALMTRTSYIPFSTTSELAPLIKSRQWTLIDYSPKDTVQGSRFAGHYYSQVTTSKQRSMRDMTEALGTNPIRVIKGSPMEIGKYVAKTPNTAFFVEYVSAHTILSENCDLTYRQDEDFPMDKLAFLFRKDQKKLVDKLNQVIVKEYAFITQVVNRYMSFSKLGCYASNQEKALRIENYFAVFALIATGFLAGSCAFGLEIGGRIKKSVQDFQLSTNAQLFGQEIDGEPEKPLAKDEKIIVRDTALCDEQPVQCE